MKSFRTFLSWIRGGCVYFTLISLVMILLNIALSDSDVASRGINLEAFLLFFPCGLGISAGSLLRKTEKLPGWASALAHYLCTVLSIFLFVWIPINPAARASTVLIMLVAFSAVYWILFLLVHLTRRRILALWEDD